jgi:exodeoxyribonuclease V beta subunit
VESLIPELIAADLAALLTGDAEVAGRKIRPADIAVLVRTNEQAAAMKQALRKLKINAVMQSRHNVFQSAEAGQLLRLLRAAADPADERAVFSALATDLLGYTAAELLDLLENEGKYQDELEQFNRWHGLWLQKGVLHLLRKVQEERESVARLLGHEDGQRKFTNYRHLAELLEQVEQSGSSHLTAVVEWLAQQIDQGQAAEEFELRLESDEDAVQLVTIHRSKGLEYPVVYCPYLWNGIPTPSRNKFLRFHDPADGWNGKFLLFPEEGELEAKQSEEFAENIRLLYVAVTRAKQSCRILWAPASGYDNSPLAYILHGAGFRRDRLPGFREWQSYISTRDHATLKDDLRQRAGAAVGWLIRDAAAGSGSMDRQSLPPRPLDFRKPLAPVVQSWRMSSFSQLASRKISLGQVSGEADHDEFSGSAAAAETMVEELPLAAFPRGPNAGNFFHQIFENISFQPTAAALELPREIGALLGRYGYGGMGWEERLLAAMKGILAAPLDRSGFALQDIDDRRRLTETEFFFPVVFGKEGGGIGTDRLLSPFRRHPAGISPAYLESVEKLHLGSLKGFMKGFIDLVFEHQGRWHIVDYKSNYLGERAADYAPGNLRRSMAEHHYYLQYHIYTVALDRYLRLRMPDYSYDRHFGGVWYLFIRGMTPDARPGQGVFFDRPPDARISLLSTIFAGEERAE